MADGKQLAAAAAAAVVLGVVVDVDFATAFQSAQAAFTECEKWRWLQNYPELVFPLHKTITFYFAMRKSQNLQMPGCPVAMSGQCRH